MRPFPRHERMKPTTPAITVASSLFFLRQNTTARLSYKASRSEVVMTANQRTQNRVAPFCHVIFLSKKEPTTQVSLQPLTTLIFLKLAFWTYPKLVKTEVRPYLKIVQVLHSS